MKPLFSFERSRSLRELKQLAKENAAEGKSLCVMEDRVFKALFGSDNEDSREALRCLLSACTRREIANVRVVKNEIQPTHIEAKGVHLDVHVTFNDGEAADLEMQIGKSGDDLKSRAAYYASLRSASARKGLYTPQTRLVYASMLLAGNSKKGDHYKDIKRVYQIFFLNCILFPGSEKLPRRYGYREETEQDELTKAVEIIFYEMPKLEQRVKDYLAGKPGTEDLSEDQKWCIYMKYRHEELVEPLIEELCRKEEGIMHAEKALSKVDRNYAKYAREMSIIKGRMERAAAIHNARLEEKLGIARNLLAEGATPEFVQKVTGLDIETITNL